MGAMSEITSSICSMRDGVAEQQNMSWVPRHRLPARMSRAVFQWLFAETHFSYFIEGSLFLLRNKDAQLLSVGFPPR